MNKQLSPRFPTPFAAFAEQRRLDCLIKDEGLLPHMRHRIFKFYPIKSRRHSLLYGRGI